MSEKEIIECEDLMELMNEVIKEEKLDFLAGVDIMPVLVYPEISPTVAGKCSVSNYKIKYFGRFQYLLEFSGELWDLLPIETKKVLCLHELYHINITHDKKGNTKYKIRKHDLEDFTQIIKRYGTEWLENIKLISQSIEDKKKENKE